MRFRLNRLIHKNNEPGLLLGLMTLVALLMRSYRLDFQSLWLDELHTAMEASPELGWKGMMHYLRHSDPQPPLHLILVRISYFLFGYNDLATRLPSVLAGTLSIPAMYLLGKAFLNKRLGMLAALLTTFNYFNLYYSQEARNYIFVFLFTALSFFFLLRLIRKPGTRNALGYVLATACLLYSHYYSLFILVAQFVIGLLSIYLEPPQKRKVLFRYLGGSALSVILTYLPWLPVMLQVGSRNSFWLKPESPDFFLRYLLEYFGDSGLILFLVVPLLFLFLYRASRKTEGTNPYTFPFLVILIWVFIGILIPYIRSITAVPMLHPRYTMIVLPGILLAVAFGIEQIGQKLLGNALAALLVLLALVNLFAEKQYYSRITKTQFREMTRYVTEHNPDNYPILNENSGWHQYYYLSRFGSEAEIHRHNRDEVLRDFLREDNRPEGFWLIEAHGPGLPDSVLIRELQREYLLYRKGEWLDAKAWQFRRRGRFDAGQCLDYHSFPEVEPFREGHDILVPLWTGSQQSVPVSLAPGEYRIYAECYGTPLDTLNPRFTMRLGDLATGQYEAAKTPDWFELPVRIHDSIQIPITFTLENDSASGKEDINLFIRKIYLTED